MATRKNKKKDNINVAVRYAVSVPEKDLMTIIKGNGAMALRLLCATVKDINKSGKIPQGFFDDLNKFAEVLESIANIVSDVHGTWGEALKPYADENRLPSDELKKLDPIKKPKKTALSFAEKVVVGRLRRKGFTIKDIGKEIHRAEKVVADYVHLIDKRAKKRK